MSIQSLDAKIISFFKKIWMPLARIALFVVFFWFGILKVIGLSPAGIVVANLFAETIAFMDFRTFYIAFGLFECLIGILFLIKGAERVVLPLLFLHMVTTAGPLAMLPGETWQMFMVPTLEGQYMIKNIVIVALAVAVAAHLHPLGGQLPEKNGNTPS
jgi:uncharacterized membrane protein YkgB